MTAVSEERRLFREAADLAIRLQNDPANPVAVEMVRAWAGRSPRHAAAWARVADIHGLTGKVFSDERKAQGGGLSRRGVLVGGGAALGLGLWAVPRVLLWTQADHVTVTAEVSRLPLPDGSVMTLGPDSAVAIDYSAARRRIALLAGMAYFEVAEDPARPFSVAADPVIVTASATAFDLSSDAGFITVAVARGAVEAGAVDGRRDGRLAAGDWMTFDPSAHALKRGRRETSEVAAWRTGMVIAENEAVSAVVARIARWQRGSVVLADPRLGARVVSGVYDLRDPTRALGAVVRPFGATVRSLGGLVTVISPV